MPVIISNFITNSPCQMEQLTYFMYFIVILLGFHMLYVTTNKNSIVLSSEIENRFDNKITMQLEACGIVACRTAVSNSPSKTPSSNLKIQNVRYNFTLNKKYKHSDLLHYCRAYGERFSENRCLLFSGKPLENEEQELHISCERRKRNPFQLLFLSMPAWCTMEEKRKEEEDPKMASGGKKRKCKEVQKNVVNLP